MREELQTLVNAERKFQRELKELRDLKHKLMQQKAPDPKTIKMIDDEIHKYTETK